MKYPNRLELSTVRSESMDNMVALLGRVEIGEDRQVFPSELRRERLRNGGGFNMPLPRPQLKARIY